MSFGASCTLRRGFSGRVMADEAVRRLERLLGMGKQRYGGHDKKQQRDGSAAFFVCSFLQINYRLGIVCYSIFLIYTTT